MKKKIITLIVGALVLTAAVPNAFAALTDSQKSDIANLDAQIASLRKQVVQKYVDGGEMTADQGKLVQERIDERQKYRTENGFLPGMGWGAGRGRGGYGGYCYGGGYGPMMGYYNGASEAPAPNQQ